MSDSRKIDAETERTAVMEEGWLEDRLGLLTNHFLTLMQVRTHVKSGWRKDYAFLTVTSLYYC